MLEGIAKAMWLMIAGAFMFGGWATTLELRAQDHSEQLKEIKNDYQSDQKRIIEILSRLDERLKNLEGRK